MTAEGDAKDNDFDNPVSIFFWFDKTEHLGIAVSGGSDSMALLVSSHEWASSEGIPISAVTVDHRLRPDAKGEAQMVADFCAAREIRHDVIKWDGWDGSGNLQARAREARYALIADWALGAGVDTVALGHTQDDQAETFSNASRAAIRC